MIVHLAPRRVSLVSKNDGQQSGNPIDLNTVLAVDLQADQAERVNLVVRLTNGERVVACTYPQMAEAGPDCGRLRVLAGLPAWGNSPNEYAPPARQPHLRLLVATAAFVLVAALVAIVLAIMELRGAGLPPV